MLAYVKYRIIHFTKRSRMFSMGKYLWQLCCHFFITILFIYIKIIVYIYLEFNVGYTLEGNSFTMWDNCTHHLISQFSNNLLVAQSSIFYVENWRQTLTFHRYVLYEERNMGNFFSSFDSKKQIVLINRRNYLIFTPRNIGNSEKYKMKCQQKR